jgi:glycine oxidase
LTKFAHALLPGLKNYDPIQSWAGLRPGIKGKHPLLGEVRSVKGLFVACGHYRNGLTLAPATAELVGDAVLGREPQVSLEGWRV